MARPEENPTGAEDINDFQSFYADFQARRSQQGSVDYDPFGFGPGFETSELIVGEGTPAPTTIAPDTGLSRIDEGSIFGVEAGLNDQTGMIQFGPETANAGEVVKQFAQGSNTEISSLQQQLKDAGYDLPVTGVWDAETNESLQRAIYQAQQQNVSLTEYLERAASVGDTKIAEQGENAYKNQLLSTYLQIWGVAPPPGYIERIMDNQMNIYEFAAFERSKPGYSGSLEYQKARVGIEQTIAQRLGRAL